MYIPKICVPNKYFPTKYISPQNHVHCHSNTARNLIPKKIKRAPIALRRFGWGQNPKKKKKWGIVGHHRGSRRVITSLRRYLMIAPRTVINRLTFGRATHVTARPCDGYRLSSVQRPARAKRHG